MNIYANVHAASKVDLKTDKTQNNIEVTITLKWKEVLESGLLLMKYTRLSK